MRSVEPRPSIRRLPPHGLRPSVYKTFSLFPKATSIGRNRPAISPRPASTVIYLPADCDANGVRFLAILLDFFEARGGVFVAVGLGFDKPGFGGDGIGVGPESAFDHVAQSELSVGNVLISGLFKPLSRYFVILFDTIARRIHKSKSIRGLWIVLFCRFVVPL